MEQQPQIAPAASQQAQADPLNATLLERRDLTDELAIFRIQPDSGQVAPFLPGQYTSLGLMETEEEAAARPSRTGRPTRPKLILRAYSIASSPKVRDYLEFFLVLVKEGALTPKLWRLREGDRLYVSPKITGKFTLEKVPPGRDLVMVATGTGLAPYVSMLHTYRDTGLWRRAVVIHGTRLAADLAYRQELEQIAREDKSVVYIPTVTREPEGSPWQGMRGRVNTLIDPDRYHELVGSPLTPDQCHVFLCGNPDMIDQVAANLQQRGFVPRDRENPHGNIHFERYW